ncbi:MAG: Zn-dependent hydrolase [Ilumatobacter sp.]|uniref:Zn-dependent hydrolase n=1 Tax=Ilumatobacter sp. TaxID=1967498 RepID=UPI00261581C1|nr:Zn-dependent hydrolase [Ilumatobacter sp.]MDJ0767299.1 Zn-dependent hydrolase [Ilumatobacter sp.]
MTDIPELRIDADRLVARIEALGEIGAVLGPNGERGSSRLALTDDDRQGRDLVVTWMRDLGLRVEIDRIGNVFATREGSDPTLAPVMTGSHIDTVATGGRFDGNLGVIAGLEVIETLITHDVTTERGVTVAFFTDEEGARFPPDMLGSLVYVGGLGVEDALDVRAVDDGARLGDELERIGYAGPRPAPAAAFPHCFVELHIEQGPILEDAGVTIGVVTGVQGISWTELMISGRSAHAGTTPMRLRRDPMLVAAQITSFVRDLTGELGADQVGTVGRLDAHPNLVNVVPASVTLTVDLRNTDEEALQLAEERTREFVAAAAGDEVVEVSQRSLARFAPVEFDPSMVDAVERVARRLGHSTQRLPSGAGHDAQMLARVCPTAMIFTPSVEGLSHNIAELTHPADLAAGADVLLHVLLERAGA